MTLICPLCGNNKPKDSLFCDNCSNKINSDFEIDIHKKDNRNISAEVNPAVNLSKSVISVDQRDLDSKPIREEKILSGSGDTKVNGTNKELYKNRSKKVRGSLFWILVAVIVLIGSYLVYNKTIHVKNIERRSWDAAVNENSVSGYLAYIESHPSGIHFDDAQAGLMKLKEDEAITWERLKVSENLDELVSFSRQYETSPYMPLVKIRIDSLSWISALKINNAESYSEYMMNSQNGILNGEYMYEASKRHEMLFQSTPINSAEIDSIRSIVNGFYASLSEMDHTGMYKYLAPEVYRFFDSGGATRERITGELMITASQAAGRRFNFEPDLEGIQYEREANSLFKVNVPLVKSYSENGSTVHLPGYIAHLELNMNFEITSIYETKPFPETL